MPSNVDPLDPAAVIPKENKAPDVTEHVKKINQRLSMPWSENEVRCGRAYIMPSETSMSTVDELIKVFSKWQVKPSVEKRGFILTFKQPEGVR